MSRKFEYKLVYNPGHPRANYKGWVCEHVIVAEQKLGRFLDKNECVHHIDGNKKNNDPSNIMVFATNADHVSFHKGNNVDLYEKDGVWYSARQKKLQLVCEYCGRQYETTKGLSRKNRKYCSHQCAQNASIKSDIDINQLVQMAYEYKGNFSLLARKLNVSSTSIHKRLKRNGFPCHSADYRN